MFYLLHMIGVRKECKKAEMMTETRSREHLQMSDWMGLKERKEVESDL
jgi:hypothetical protein